MCARAENWRASERDDQLSRLKPETDTAYLRKCLDVQERISQAESWHSVR